MSDAFAMQRREFPARIAELGFAVELPADWIAHTLPDEATDFDDPTTLVPLTVVTAPHALLVWTAAARPAYDDGTVSDWARYLVEHGGLSLKAFSNAMLGELAAIVGLAEQGSDYGPMQVYFAFAEDGGRLINLSLSAPMSLASAVEPVWRATLSSFALQTPHGPTVRVWPAPSTDDSAVVQVNEYVEPASPDTSPAPSAPEPAWWRAALALEAAGHLEEAELAIRAGVQHQGGLLQIAEMYRLRHRRLREAGDASGARDAHDRATNWVNFYAASATSGGEGAALSVERDRYLAELGAR